MEEEEEARIALAWAKKNGMYFASGAKTAEAYFHHFVTCLKQLRGRADAHAADAAEGRIA